MGQENMDQMFCCRFLNRLSNEICCPSASACRGPCESSGFFSVFESIFAEIKRAKAKIRFFERGCKIRAAGK